MMRPTAILFLSSVANYSGAPIDLIRFLGWVRAHCPYRILVMLQHGGELEKRFCAIGSTRVWKRPLKTKRSWLRKIQEFIRWEGMRNYLSWFRIRFWLLRFRVVLVYANTAFCGESLALLRRIQAPRVCRLHEMNYTLKNFRYPQGYSSFKQTLRFCDDFIVVSEAVGRNLHRSYGVSQKHIYMVHGSVNFVDADAYLDPQRTTVLKKKLGIPSNDYVIGACGSLHWHKGPDLFVQLARITERMRREDIHFLWLGGDVKHSSFHRLEFDIENAGLTERVHFVGHQNDPYPYYAIMDVLAMVSRVEALGLVNVEASQLGKPMVCFRNSGGPEEWAARGCGKVVSYLDLEAFARKILNLLDDVKKRNRMAAVCRIESSDLLVDNNAPRIYQIMEMLMVGKA